MIIYLDEEVDEVDEDDEVAPIGTIIVYRYTESKAVFVTRFNGKRWEYPDAARHEIVHGDYIQIAAFVPEETDS